MIELSAIEQLKALRSGKISAAELMTETYERIEAVNPQVNAIVALQDHEKSLLAADQSLSGPLAGLPMAIKDLEETNGIATTFGSPAFADYIPVADSPLTARLRKAGAIIIGKTNTPEFGLGSHSYNPVYGVTRNPYDNARSAGGSSGGAGAALACRMVALADGSDMMGSLRNPAGWNNVYGFRPSFGLVPGGGPGDIFLNQLSTAGPMARTVPDLELLLTVLSEKDPNSPHSIGPYVPGPVPRGLKIGWLGDWGGALPIEPGILELCEAGLKTLTEMGHVIEVMTPPFPAENLWDAWVTLRHFYVAEKFRALYASSPDLMKPELIWEVEQGLTLPGSAIYRASVVASDWFRTTSRMQVDVMALPSAQLFPFPAEWDWPKQIAGTTMDTYHRWMQVVVPASLTGLPALSVPVGFGAEGLAGGMQFIGHRGSDAMILGLGRAYDAATNWVSRAP